MAHLRTLGTLAALGLVAALVAAPPADANDAPVAVAAQSQTIRFTSTPPSGEDWYTSGSAFFHQYVATATASSGLPVEYSIAPASAGVCRIGEVYHDDPFWGSGAGIDFLGAGTCTVLADQPGNDGYLPAPQAAQSFQVEKVQTWLYQVRARKGLPGYTPATFSATLKTWEFIDSHTVAVEPFRGEPVTFLVAGHPACSATTDSNGVATCRVVLPRAALTRLRFTASYAGTKDYKPVSASAFFLG